MVAFQLVKANFALLGITAHQSIQPNRLNSLKILMAFFMFGIIIILHFMYIFYVANTFDEYVECITLTSGKFVIVLFLCTVVYRMATLFKYLDVIEEIKAMSEYYDNVILHRIKPNANFFRIEKSRFRCIVL